MKFSDEAVPATERPVLTFSLDEVLDDLGIEQPTDDPEYLTIAEWSEILGVGPRQARTKITEGVRRGTWARGRAIRKYPQGARPVPVYKFIGKQEEENE